MPTFGDPNMVGYSDPMAYQPPPKPYRKVAAVGTGAVGARLAYTAARPNVAGRIASADKKVEDLADKIANEHKYTKPRADLIASLGRQHANATRQASIVRRVAPTRATKLVRTKRGIGAAALLTTAAALLPKRRKIEPDGVLVKAASPTEKAYEPRFGVAGVVGKSERSDRAVRAAGTAGGLGALGYAVGTEAGPTRFFAHHYGAKQAFGAIPKSKYGIAAGGLAAIGGANAFASRQRLSAGSRRAAGASRRGGGRIASDLRGKPAWRRPGHSDLIDWTGKREAATAHRRDERAGLSVKQHQQSQAGDWSEMAAAAQRAMDRSKAGR